MNYLDKILTILKTFKQYFLFLVILGLLIVIYFKNNTLNKLRGELSEKPRVEYVYPPPVIKTIKGDSIPYPVKVEKIKWRDKIVEVPVEVEKPINLTKEDSASIAEAYARLYDDYSTIRTYEKVFMDDSVAYIKVYEQVQYNKLLNNKIDFERRYPTTRITTVKQDKTLSLIGGLDASIGTDFNAISLGVGFVTPSNSVYLFKYDPVNKGFGGAVYLPIFNIKK